MNMAGIGTCWLDGQNPGGTACESTMRLGPLHTTFPVRAMIRRKISIMSSARRHCVYIAVCKFLLNGTIGWNNTPRSAVLQQSCVLHNKTNVRQSMLCIR